MGKSLWAKKVFILILLGASVYSNFINNGIFFKIFSLKIVKIISLDTNEKSSKTLTLTLHSNLCSPETSRISPVSAQPKLRKKLRIDLIFRNFGRKKSRNP
jgi:hypothetical protein